MTPPREGRRVGDPFRSSSGAGTGFLGVQVAGMKFHLDPILGQKTGFISIRPQATVRWLPGAKGRRVLDCFSNQGAFAIACAQAGATEVTAVESGKENLPRIEANATLNGVALKVVGGDVFEVLSSAARREEVYDLIILDPPPFTRTRKGIADALRGYRELHLRPPSCFPGRIASPTFSCSHHVTAAEFGESVAGAFGDARRTARQFRSTHRVPTTPSLSVSRRPNTSKASFTG